ncbi:MAG TPA: peptide chain release factor 1 [Burkholderiales bacterium]|nr:peptide chain release factor 1 [Burkholderiales bacterium]
MDLLEKLAGIEGRYDELNLLMTDPAVIADYNRLRETGQERTSLEPIVHAYHDYREALRHLDEAKSLAANETDADWRAMAEEEVVQLQEQIAHMENNIKVLLVPQDPRDERNVIVEIRAGTGGDEAGIFAADLFRMYSRYAENHNWKSELLSSNETGVGGFKEVIFMVKGKGAYSRMKYESGVHRVQRVPVTESQGRIHTSTATVAVLPEVDEVEIDIPDKDIEIDVYKSQGAGGQNVQKNATAVRIHHLPTGIIVQCQDERSQLQNRLRAMSILRARLYELEQEKQLNEQTATRRSQVGTGERSEKIRTYNFPQNRVTDHRINLTSYQLDSVLSGDLDEFIDELTTRDQAEKLQAAGL